METPSQADMQAKLGISQAYASMVLRGDRNPSRPLAIRILREFGWKHSVLDGLTPEQIDMLESIDPWTGKQDAAA